MENKRTPKPGSDNYDVENPQNLNTPQFNSATENRDSGELPAIENLNDQEKDTDHPHSGHVRVPGADLGNDRGDDEDEREKIIRR